MRDDDTFSRRTLLRTTGALASASLLPGAASARSSVASATPGDTPIETTTGNSEPRYEQAPPESVYVQTEFETADGATESPQIYGEIVRPQDPETGTPIEDVPVILTYSPYNDLKTANRQAPGTLATTGIDPTSVDPENPPQPPESKSTAHDGTADYFVPRGYARAVFDLVGTRNSGGKYDYGGIRERKTAAQVVEWLADQPWSNGKVGMVGGSYDGTTQYAAAIEDPDGLETIVPQVAIDRWYDYAFVGGIRYNFTGGGGGTPYAFDFGFAVAPPLDADPEAVATMQARARPGDRVEHTVQSLEYDTLYDAFWDRRDYEANAEDITASVYVEGGWLDNNVKHWDSIRMFNALPDDHPKKLVMGQWGHATNQFEDALDVRHAWFDYWLLGEDTGVMDLPRVDTQINTGERFQHEQFPPARTQELAIPLVRSAPAPGELELLGTGTPVYDDTKPAVRERDMFAERSSGDGHLMFETPPLSQPLRFSGTPLVDLQVSTTGTSTHFTPVLYQRAPDGTTTIISRGGLNAKNRHSLRDHDAIPTDRPFRAPVPLWDIDHEVPEGHRLGLVVASDNNEWIREDPDGNATNEIIVGAPGERGGTTLRLPVTSGRGALAPNAPELPGVAVSRSDDGSVFTGGMVDQVTIDVTTATREVRLRDRVPDGWTVVAGDGTAGDEYVEFAPAETGDTRTYFVEAPTSAADTGQYTFGPVEFSPDDGETWLTLDGTTDTNTVVGTEPPTSL